ncbi:MAG TPA: TatD family nuclease-associated radical SAM protein [Clostridia bacterium]|nr:TatD family nuclease-associated radical SAM protein [Clostridia bacterium]
MDTITYQIGNGVYINLTNKCSNDCVFCERNRISGVEGYYLWLKNEPTAEMVIENLKTYDLKDFDEVIFCGFGEPTYKWNVIKDVAVYAHSIGKSTRLNTNGQGNLINGYDITQEIANYIDKVNVSLNNGNSKRYNEDNRSIFGEVAFQEIQNFAKKCIEKGVHTTFSVVDCISKEEIEGARQIALAIGANFRVREEIK